MNPVIGGAIISGLGSLIGGWMGNDADDDAATRNENFQREMRDSSLTSLVSQARKAGISPLAALGHNLSGGIPTAVGGDNMGQALERMGQDTGRAMMATGSSLERELGVLAVERGGIENDIARLQLMKMQQGGQLAPGVDGTVREIPNDVTMSRPDATHATAGTTPESLWGRGGKDGRYVIPYPSKEIQEALEDDPIGLAAWKARNLANPGTPPGRSELRKGESHFTWVPGIGWHAERYSESRPGDKYHSMPRKEREYYSDDRQSDWVY